ncbi:hypothetical protein FAGAP_2031 [Fusarium agapanthi]|uniref:Uncharacterized protein n=1 Tax=Fusarium agapanthi TaxID=1803897 RepID=A0A9P5EG74_9HYPO|nr:hypothetical protein FAGAP_2031 [Fusarium agapanthi]
MAHNSDRLPWDALASTLELRHANPCQHDAYSLHALVQPGRRAKLANFVDIFIQSIAEDAAQQRKQYPEEYRMSGVGIQSILQQFPETWDAGGSPIDDYRNLAAYPAGGTIEDFLGIEKDQFWWNPRRHDVPRWKHIMRFDTNGFENYQKGLDRFGFPYSDDESDAESHDGSSTMSDK